MAQPTAGQAVTWEVSDVQETTIGSPIGRLEKGFNVYYRTNTGLNGSIFVPETSFNTDNVSQLIGQKVAAAEGVRTLTGTVGG